MAHHSLWNERVPLPVWYTGFCGIKTRTQQPLWMLHSTLWSTATTYEPSPRKKILCGARASRVKWSISSTAPSQSSPKQREREAASRLPQVS